MVTVLQPPCQICVTEREIWDYFETNLGKKIRSWEAEKTIKAMKRTGHYHRSRPSRLWEGGRPAERPFNMAGAGPLTRNREAISARAGWGSRWQPPANASSSRYTVGKREARHPGTRGGEAPPGIPCPAAGTAVQGDLDKLEGVQRRV